MISASVGIPVVLLAVFGGVPGISWLVLAAALVAAYELSRMARASGLRSYPAVTVPVVAITAAGVTAGLTGGQWAGWAFVAASAITVAVLVIAAPGSRGSIRPIAIFGSAAIFYGIALAHAAPLAGLVDGRDWVLLAVLTTFAADTGAFFAGSTFGRRLLARSISPKKTWEGVGGAVVAGAGVAMALDAVLGLPMALWAAAATGVAMAAAGVAGDLYESWLKRRAGVKDSGALIPGHGGILDRIDSLAPNLAVVYWAAQWSGA